MLQYRPVKSPVRRNDTQIMAPFLDPAARREHRRRNLQQSALLIAGIGAVVAVAAWLIWGAAGVVACFLVIGLVTAFAPRVPPEVVMRLYRAQRVAPGRGGQLGSLVDELARRAELPARPELYVVPSLTLNAFATGTPRHAAIAVTEGLLRRLTMREITAVLAHEMSHIRNNDLWIMSLADLMTRLVQTLSYVALTLALLNIFAALNADPVISWSAILLLYAAPAISSLLQLGLSRAREFDADLEAVMLTGDPLGLASALRRLERSTGHFWEDLMFPVPGRRVPVPSLLRTHPPTEDRIRRLLAMEGRPTLAQIPVAEEPMVSLVGWGPIEMRPRHRWPGIWF
jgi:heat shock protein HtpX